MKVLRIKGSEVETIATTSCIYGRCRSIGTCLPNANAPDSHCSGYIMLLCFNRIFDDTTGTDREATAQEREDLLKGLPEKFRTLPQGG